MTIQVLLDAMWQDYLQLNPEVNGIYKSLAAQNNNVIVNDHIALRTFDIGKVSIDKIAAPFLSAGYECGGDYDFVTKKLYAKHFQHPNSRLPKVFISELKVSLLSSNAQSLINRLVAQLDEARVSHEGFCYSGRPWSVSYRDYKALLAESEYAAWMSAFGYRPNHFTVSVNHLQSHDSLESLNTYLQEIGVSLNVAGGKIKGSPSELLEQSSTLANEVEVVFTDKKAQIASCYYEFAKRYPMSDGELYQGFIAKSADKIFESTNVSGVSVNNK
jgi:hypothetical protein